MSGQKFENVIKNQKKRRNRKKKLIGSWNCLPKDLKEMLFIYFCQLDDVTHTTLLLISKGTVPWVFKYHHFKFMDFRKFITSCCERNYGRNRNYNLLYGLKTEDIFDLLCLPFPKKDITTKISNEIALYINEHEGEYMKYDPLFNYLRTQADIMAVLDCIMTERFCYLIPKKIPIILKLFRKLKLEDDETSTVMTFTFDENEEEPLYDNDLEKFLEDENLQKNPTTYIEHSYRYFNRYVSRNFNYKLQKLIKIVTPKK